jgi:diguanylate cyclase (GGDEF)-like protein
MGDEVKERNRFRATSLWLLISSGARSDEGGDPKNAALIIALICTLSAALAAVFLPIDPPDQTIGDAGWAVAVALILAGYATGRTLRVRSPSPGYEALLAISYVGLFAVATLEWLAGGTATAYTQLTLLWLGAAMGVHPLARALPFLLVTGLVTAAPLLYAGWSSELAEELAATYLFTAALGVLTFALLSYVRAQRVELRDAERHAQALAHGDALTGLGNRRAFDEALEAELGRSRRAASTTSVVLVDLDRLKQINDRFGHLDGDRCLRDTAAAITRALRAGDRAFRWGGDEFVLLLPDTDLEGAEQAAERVAAEVLSTCAAANGAPLSVSWGVAEASEGMDAAELLGRADIELLTLKREKLRAS